VLVLGQWTPVPSDIASGVPPDGPVARALIAGGAATLALLALFFAPLVRRDRVARFLAAGAALSLLPIAATFPQDRLLFFVGLGSMGLLARWTYALVAEPALLPAARWWRASAWAGAAALLAVHLALAPLAARLVLAFQSRVNERMVAAIASVPSDPAVVGQDLVLVNPPDFVYTVGAIAPVKWLSGEANPRRILALAGAPTAMEITRSDARTLRVHLDDALFNVPMTRYYRAPELRFAVGDRVALPGLSIEVLDVDAAGDPDTLRFRFDVALEDASLRWLAWHDGAWIPWRPPGIGESTTLPAPKGLYD
jgi:hypothetical protein